MQQDIIALYDQVQAEMRQQGRIVAAYFKQLRDEGVDPYAAVQLTLAFQRDFVFALPDPKPPAAEED